VTVNNSLNFFPSFPYFYRVMKRIILLITLLFSFLSAQFGIVHVNLDQRLLKDSDRYELSNMKDEIERFFNVIIWDEDFQDLNIPLNIQIVFQGTAQKGSQKTYHVQALFSDTGDIRYFDKAVQFYYTPGGSIYYDAVIFDPLAGFLAFYGYLILAGQVDTYEFYGGTQYFEKARSIALRGISSDYPKGWSQRSNTVNEIIDNKGLREARFAYYLGRDLFQQGHLEAAISEFKAMNTALKTVFKLFPVGRTLYFLKAHAEDLSSNLEMLGQKEILKDLIDLDPNHKEIYEKALLKIP